MPVNNTFEHHAKITGLEIYEQLDSLLECRDLVLLLTYVSPIRGTTHLQKQTFLLWRMLNDVSTDPGFFPYKFGPYSQVVADSVKDLKGEGFLRERLGKEYCITDRGRAYIKKKMEHIEIDSGKIARHKTKWDEWDARGITRYIYRIYPKYTEDTEVPQLKW